MMPVRGQTSDNRTIELGIRQAVSRQHPERHTLNHERGHMPLLLRDTKGLQGGIWF